MPEDTRSTHNNLPVPDPANDVNEDIPRIGVAIEAIGTLIKLVQDGVAGSAADAHEHTLDDIQGLNDALAALSSAIAALDVPSLAALDDVDVSSATNGMVLLYLGSAWQAAKIAAENVTVGVDSSVAAELAAINLALGNFAQAIADLGALAVKDQIGTGDVKADEVRAELETEVKTRISEDNEPEFYDPVADAWKKFSSSTGSPVGSAAPWFSDIAPNALWVIVKDVGQVFSRGAFPQLLDAYAPERTVVITNGSAVVTGIGSANGFAAGMAVEGAEIPADATILSVDAADQVTLSTAATADGTLCRVFPYGNGDGVSTANFPEFAGRYLRGWDPSGAVSVDAAGRLGGILADTFQGHWHENHGAYSLASGSTTNMENANAAYNRTFQDKVRDAVTDGINGAPRTSDETRPKTFIATWIVKVADGVDDPALITAASVLQDLAAAVSDIAALQAAMPKKAELEVTSFSNGVWYTVPHGLGERPNIVQLFAECVVATGGYSVGERVMLGTVDSSNNDGSAVNYGCGLSADATSIRMATGNSGSLIVHGTANHKITVGSAFFKLVAVAVLI